LNPRRVSRLFFFVRAATGEDFVSLPFVLDRRPPRLFRFVPEQA